jgi:hypothetical protein
MKAYLAQKYMSGPKADAILAREQPKKKKKRKHADGGQQSHSGGGTGIVDDDGDGEQLLVKTKTMMLQRRSSLPTAPSRNVRLRRATRVAGYLSPLQRSPQLPLQKKTKNP